MEKKDQRKSCLAARRALSDEKRREKSARIGAKLAQNKAVLGAKTVLSYLSAADEVDLSAFHRWADAAGKRIAYPISGAAGQMVAAIPATEEDIIVGRFGIRAPVGERSEIIAPETIDVVLVPCVGFDRQRRRLGHGGGYYDRYLPQCTNAHTILVAFAEQEVAEVPVEEHDVVMDEIVVA